MTIRILVIDDHPMVRAGVRAELENSGADLEVVGDASDVEGAIAACRALTPDVALLDVHLPGGNGGGGAEVASTCRDIEGLHFLALSVSDAAEDVVQVIRAGARGYVTKSISTPDLVEAIGRVAAGDAAFSPRLAGFVLDAFGTGEVSRPTPSWTCCPRASRRSCASSPAATRTRKSPTTCSSPSRPSKPT